MLNVEWKQPPTAAQQIYSTSKRVFKRKLLCTQNTKNDPIHVHASDKAKK